MRLLCLLYILLAYVPMQVMAQTPVVHWARYEYDVAVQRNGDLLFTETQELVVDSGTLRRGRLQFNTGSDGRVRQIQVSEGNRRYQRNDSGQPGTFVGSDNGQQAIVEYYFQDPSLTRHTPAMWAAANGESYAVCHAIETHMYPFSPRPRTREAWVVSVADKAASLTDLTITVTGAMTGKTWKRRRTLRASDPFYALCTRRRWRKARRGSV